MSMVFNGVSKAYGRRAVICHLQADLPCGVHHIHADNGAGKTTLLQLAVALAKPTWGEISWFGSSLSDSIRTRRAAAAFCPADPSFYDSASVSDAIRAYRSMHCLDDLRDPFSGFDPFDLSDWRDSRFGSLSFGWRKRVLLHMVFCARPDIMALDEPTVGLDATGLAALSSLIAARRRDTITIIAGHGGVASELGFGMSHSLSTAGVGISRRTTLRVEGT